MDNPRVAPTFSVSKGILDPKHVTKIRGAIWLFLYLIDRVTVEQNGVGLVLRGKPITDEEISKIGLDRRSIIRYRATLIEGGYIKVKRTARGYIYTVENSKKFRNGGNGKSRSAIKVPEPVDDLGPGLTDEEIGKLIAEADAS